MASTRETVTAWLRAYVRAVAIDANLAVANGRTRYFKDASKAELVRDYDNLFLIELDDQGRCRSFREWYMSPRGQMEPA